MLRPVRLFVVSLFLLLVFPGACRPDSSGIQNDTPGNNRNRLLRFPWVNLLPKVFVSGRLTFLTRVERRGNFCVLNIYCSASGKTMTISAGGFTFISRNIEMIFTGDDRPAAMLFIGIRSIPNRDVFLYDFFSEKLVRLTFTPSDENVMFVPDNEPGPGGSFIMETATGTHRFKYSVSLENFNASLIEKSRLPAEAQSEKAAQGTKPR